MNTLLKNKSMQLTIISGFLILLGIIIEQTSFAFLAPYIFILSFIIGGYKQAVNGFKDTIESKRLNVDILMVLAAIGASIIGYWLEGALLIFIFSLSGSLEEYAMNKSTQAITALMNLQPETAKRLKDDGSIEEVPVASLQIGDKVLVPKGTSVPIDGEILQGTSLFDEASITGESIPVDKGASDLIFGGTMNLSNGITMTVTKNPDDTLFAKIIKLVKEAQSTPSKTATLLNKIESVYVVIVLISVPIAIAIFYFGLHWTWNESFYRGMVLLTVASPCALVASATPATLAAISNGARQGILFKGGAFLENFVQLNAIVFDKTGTLTQGRPQVTDMVLVNHINQDTVFSLVAAMESTSTHPIAQAIMTYINLKPQDYALITDLADHTGSGLSANFLGSEWKIGKLDFVNSESLTADDKGTIVSLQESGKTLVFVQKDNQVVTYFALLDMPKAGAKEMLSYFNHQGIETIMMTGDNQKTGQTIGNQIGISQVFGNCLPEEKVSNLQNIQKKYPVIAMVGDGINDAPALANASIGIAMGGGTDIAIEVSDVVLMDDHLDKLSYCHKLSAKLRKITIQNMVFSICVILLLITANLFQYINLPLGVVGHEGSTILVILNGLRLLRKID
ncbi:heavy metal translocating P-type ATPase [Granulicatella seriolae]|uniref:Heavy metal translocating P-type ATPase n=1 Tax=Granulicatella seriolae TaxID=2967226 RepID=A0ABT1WL38_9LACT|nr:heavy metal translocating P-type ATPase [Granulicatella seriolae]